MPHTKSETEEERRKRQRVKEARAKKIKIKGRTPAEAKASERQNLQLIQSRERAAAPLVAGGATPKAARRSTPCAGP